MKEHEKHEKHEKRLAGCIIIVVALLATPFLYALDGWVLSILWRWFIVPFDAPVLSVPAAIGVSIVVGFLTHQITYKHGRDGRSAGEQLEDSLSTIGTALVLPFITLLTGYIVSLFL